ncbi:hypothetical protein ACFLQ9_01270, partial [Bacteroidota bacterium]
MKNIMILIVLIVLSLMASSQINASEIKNDRIPDFLMGSNLGISCSYNDYAYNISFPVSLSLDYHIKNGYYLQIAPKYSWLFRWNEHYLTLP